MGLYEFLAFKLLLPKLEIKGFSQDIDALTGMMVSTIPNQCTFKDEVSFYGYE